MASLLAALLLSYLFSAFYMLWINPEIRFWKEAYRRKIEWARTLTTEGRPKIVFVGGSSTAFQIDAGMLTHAGIPSVNMGMHAGMGSRATAAFGLSAVAKGDTVIWGFETDRLTKPPELEPLGYQALIATGVLFGSGPERLAIGHLDPLDILNSLRPGLDHCAVMLAKVALQHPLYRYKKEFIRPGGAITTDERRPISRSSGWQTFPDSTTLVWISAMSSGLTALGCSSAYLIPKSYVPPGDAVAALKENKYLLERLNLITTVIPDPVMGVETNLECFADTPAHFRADAMKERTRDLIPLFSTPQKAPLKHAKQHDG
jgi:hypothetical protein